jgi:hypothetical protein
MSETIVVVASYHSREAQRSQGLCFGYNDLSSIIIPDFPNKFQVAMEIGSDYPRRTSVAVHTCSYLGCRYAIVVSNVSKIYTFYLINMTVSNLCIDIILLS